jgi:agmatinase
MPNRRDPSAEGRGAADVSGGMGDVPSVGPDPSERSPNAGDATKPTDHPSSLRDLPWELPHSFLGLQGREAAFEPSRAVILPVPYESTTSYSGGTRNGPRGIVEASRYVEVYDQELDTELTGIGVHTLPAVELTRAGSTEAMAELEEVYGRFLDAIGDRFPVMLGGEHAVSAPAIRATAARTSERLTILNMDAHADLRDGYEGAPWSHASFAYRVLDVADYLGVGIRAVSPEEVEVIRGNPGVSVIWADEMWEDDSWMDRAMEKLGDPVYLTFDVDYFDPSLMPSTGTPEPGGGDWYRTLRFLRRVFRERRVVGVDVVELAPTPGLHAPDFLVAKLVAKLLAYRFLAGN